ncbi:MULTISPECIES: HamA C-terminal domain-containing protein [Burkholderia]|uniref:HamA C-terminal domain-containing protein n=1 Tax=Burkholderia TaxID=32008 RepID=UPI00064F2A4C|nr:MULTISPECIES: DUF1837 domain-containing protein [Burkholderia]KML07909.1 hypothetical protein VL00_26920 [Burkholderia cepacia]KMN62518.1 hypothetical protein VK92_01965 [Burkholderia sp. LK4]
MEEKDSRSTGMERFFAPLIGPSFIDARVRRLTRHTEDLPEVSAHFLYPAFQNDRPAIEALVDALKYCILPFCTTKEELAKAKRADAAFPYGSPEIQRLLETAKRRFMRATKSGEGGELLLFAFIEHFLQAPIILSKMRLKTSTRMPVHGADGVHARWDSKNNRLVIIFGESKVHASCSSAIKAAAKSVGDFANNVDDRKTYELQLTTDHIDLDGFPEGARTELLRYLHPFATHEANRREDRFAILLAYESAAYGELEDVDSAELAFAERYREDLEHVLRHARSHLKEHKVSLRHVDLFVFPLPNVGQFRKQFEDALRV